MATRTEIETFLASVERRAFKQAVYAVREEESALDIVQDAMIKLTEKYSDKPMTEIPPLFQRILQNVIMDHFRRQKVRNTWTVLLSSLRGDSDEDSGDRDILETIEVENGGQGSESAADQVERSQVLALIEVEVKKLPKRQREAVRIILGGDLPSPLNPPSGCRFRTRCPFVMDVCAQEAPPLVQLDGGGYAACHLHTSGPKLAGASLVEFMASRNVRTID